MTVSAQHLKAKKQATIVNSRVGACVALNIYEQMRSKKPCAIDLNVKSREGALICPSGRPFTVLTAPYVPRTAPNGAAELM